MLGTVPARSGADLLVEVGDRGVHARLMRGRHFTRSLLITQAVQDRDVLVRAEHQVPCGHGVLPWRAAELLAGAGILPAKELLERLRRALTFQPQGAGAAAVVDAGGLAVAGQVLLTV